MCIYAGSFCVHNTCLAIHYMCQIEWSLLRVKYLSLLNFSFIFFFVIGHRFNGNKPFYKLIFLNIDFLMQNNLYFVKFLVNMSKWLFHSRANCNRKCLYATIVKFKILEFQSSCYHRSLFAGVSVKVRYRRRLGRNYGYKLSIKTYQNDK